MSEDTNTATQDTGVETQDTTKATQEPLEFNGENFVLHGRTVEKGKNKGNVIYTLGPMEGQSRWDFICAYRRAVGAENFDKAINSMILSDCKDATLQAMSKAEDGIVTDDGFCSALTEGYVDSTRRSGPHVKDIKERLAAIFAEVSPLMTRMFDPKAEKLTDAEHNKAIQLNIEFSDLNAKLEKIQGARKGKKKTATAAAVTK